MPLRYNDYMDVITIVTYVMRYEEQVRCTYVVSRCGIDVVMNTDVASRCDHMW